MGFFSDKFDYQEYNVYSIKPYISKKMIALYVIAIILVIVFISLSIFYIVNTTIRLEKNKKFASQVIEYKEEQDRIAEEERQKEIERKAKIPELTEVGKANFANIYNQDTKKVYLTFDDGPSNNTPDILNILKENDIKATFFVLGSQVQYFPETTNRLYNEGHYIANHGYTHRYNQIYKTPEQVLIEYNQCNEIVAKTIGVPEYNSHLFRFPGGYIGGKYAAIKEEAAKILEANNILHIDWNALTGDAEKAEPTEEYLMNNLQNTTVDKNNIVILMHDSQAKRITVDFLPKVIEFFKNQGFAFDNFYSIIK